MAQMLTRAQSARSQWCPVRCLGLTDHKGLTPVANGPESSAFHRAEGEDLRLVEKPVQPSFYHSPQL